MSLRHSLPVLLLAAAFAWPCQAGETATLRNGFSIHYLRRQAQGEVTRLFLTESVDSFVDVPTEDILEIEQDTVTAPAPPAVKPEVHPHSNSSPHGVNLDEALSAASQHNNLSPELVRSVVQAESGFNPNARSGKGAQGLMQLMPQTASQMGVKNAWDPAENLEGGARYLSSLLDRFDNNLPVALAAYNAGPERVQEYHGIPPYPETIAYVNRILRDLYWPTVSVYSVSKTTPGATRKPASKTAHAAKTPKPAEKAKWSSAVIVPKAHEPVEGN